MQNLFGNFEFLGSSNSCPIINFTIIVHVCVKTFLYDEGALNILENLNNVFMNCKKNLRACFYN